MIGLHIQADSGRSEDELYNIAIASGGRTFVVLNGPGLAARLLQAGKRVIYRRWAKEQTTRGVMSNGDNNADETYDPVDFVNRIHAAAPAGAILALGNEMWLSNADQMRRQSDWTVKALERCEQLGRKGGIFSVSTGNPPNVNLWHEARPALQKATDGGHYLLLHEYFGNEKSTDALSSKNRPWHIERYSLIPAGLPVPEIIITELGLAYDMDPHKGYVGRMSDDAYADQLIAVQRVYAARGIESCVFVLTNKGNANWDTFNVSEKLVARIAAYNVTEVVTPPPTADTRTTAVRANVRKQPSLSADVLTMLDAGTVVYIKATTEPDAQGYRWYGRVEGGYLREDVFTDYVAPSVPSLPIKLLYPLKRFVQTDRFGAYRDYSAIAPGKLPEHEGDDFGTVPAGDTDADVLMGNHGVVENTGYSAKGYGNWVRVLFDGDDGQWRMWYGHLSRIDVAKGERIGAGEALGKAGNSGNSSGVHVHATLTHPTHGLDGYVIDKVVNPAGAWVTELPPPPVTEHVTPEPEPETPPAFEWQFDTLQEKNAFAQFLIDVGTNVLAAPGRRVYVTVTTE